MERRQIRIKPTKKVFLGILGIAIAIAVGIGIFEIYKLSKATLVIPEGVETINRSQYNSKDVKKVIIPNSVTSIEADAFDGWESLTSVVWNAKKCTDFSSSDNSPFHSISTQITSFVFGEDVEYIPAYLCYEMSKLTAITIPNSVTSIGYRAFKNCSSLTSVTLNSNTIVSNDNIYEGSYEDDYEDDYEDGEPEEARYDEWNIIHIFGKQVTEYVIGDSVTSIGHRAFKNCRNLTSITIPNSVTWIGMSAFENCKGLTSVTIPNSITWIGPDAFSGCSGLTSVTIPNSITWIGPGAFSGCSNLPVINNVRYADTYLVEAVDKNLSTYNIKNGTRWIGSYAFSGCSNLTSITIPNSVTSIEADAFSGCSGLTSVTIPNSVTSIRSSAFSSCSSLTTIIVEKGNTVYDSRNNCNAIIETATNTLIAGCGNTIIPNSVTSIGNWAFENCSSLTSITIPNSVTSIGDWAFKNCSSLTSITIPNSVTSIERYTFSDCSSLTSVTIPNSVTSIGDRAFENCSSLTTIYNYAEMPQYIDYVAFYNVDITCTLYVPANSIELYQEAKVWRSFSDIKPIFD